MSTLDVERQPAFLLPIYNELRADYPQGAEDDLLAAVIRAWQGICDVGLAADPDAERLTRVMARHDVRVLLELEVDNARLDPERHVHRQFARDDR